MAERKPLYLTLQQNVGIQMPATASAIGIDLVTGKQIYYNPSSVAWVDQSAFTGSISGTVAGNPFIVAGPNIRTHYNSLGQWEFTGSNYFTETALNKISTTGSVAMTYLSASTGGEVTGSFKVNGGITGSITKLIDGSNYLIASGAVSLTTTSFGAVNILVHEDSGNYTPVLSFSGGGTPTYASQTGMYYKIGKIVQVNFALALSNLGVATGDVHMINLPFTSHASNDGAGSGQVIVFKNVNNSNRVSSITAYIGSNDVKASLYAIGTPAVNSTTLTNANLTNTTQLSGSLYYIANA